MFRCDFVDLRPISGTHANMIVYAAFTKPNDKVLSFLIKNIMKQKIAIAFGGKSPEHQVSLHSATTICNALDQSQFDVILLGNDRKGAWYYNVDYVKEHIDLAIDDYFEHAREVYMQENQGGGVFFDSQTHELLASFSVVFPIIHGIFGEDGCLQGFFNFLGIPFVGSGVLGSSICMDKEITKRVLRDNGIPITRFICLNKANKETVSFEEVVNELGNPFFVKPCNAGSSFGVSKVDKKADFKTAIALAFQFDKKILLEEAVEGKEIECSVLGNEFPISSVLGEITTTTGFYSYDVKYWNTSRATLCIPAEIPVEISNKIRVCAIHAYRATCCEGFARVDFFLKANGNFVVNEINTLPGFTAYSMYPKLFEYAGLSIQKVVSRLIALALETKERN